MERQTMYGKFANFKAAVEAARQHIIDGVLPSIRELREKGVEKELINALRGHGLGRIRAELSCNAPSPKRPEAYTFRRGTVKEEHITNAGLSKREETVLIADCKNNRTLAAS
ncbi:hypothetical protein HZC09_06465 [Candidatus Micrarchaeota archaeon]|nr:hypothetical protein [Candidatus Micrarchaeota archaeon]